LSSAANAIRNSILRTNIQISPTLGTTSFS
jgi:hypothetical protein